MPIDPNEIIVILDDPDFQALFPSDNRNFAAFAALILAHARARIGEANILQRLASLEAAATTARDKINTLSYLQTVREYAAALENERGQHNITKDKVKEFERYADNAQAKVDALKQEVATANSRLAAACGIIDQLGDECDRLKQEVALANGRLEQAATGWQERENALVSAAERNAEKAQAWEAVVACLHKHNLPLYPQPEATGMAAACGIIDRLVAERERANAAQAGVESLTHDLMSCMTQRDTAIARAEKMAGLLEEARSRLRAHQQYIANRNLGQNAKDQYDLTEPVLNRIDAALTEQPNGGGD